MFLIGGPAFSGTTLLAHLLNQGTIVCLDEPDLHNPDQSHRGIPFLKRRFPAKQFPEQPEKALTYTEAVRLIEKCEEVIGPHNLGFKTCNRVFIEYATIYNDLGYPVIAIVRDIRDALVRSLPAWLTEEKLNKGYRLIWEHLKMFDLWVRYEDLVMNPERVMARISRVLSYDFKVLYSWNAKSVHPPMFKLDRHELLKTGTISTSRIGIWKSAGKALSKESHQTAQIMGY